MALTVHGGDPHGQSIEHFEAVEPRHADLVGNTHPLFQTIKQATGRVDVAVEVEEIEVRRPRHDLGGHRPPGAKARCPRVKAGIGQLQPHFGKPGDKTLAPFLGAVIGA